MMDKIKDIYKKMTGREKALLYAAITVFIIMITDLLILHPILSHIKVLEGKINAKSQAIQRDMRILSFKESILKEYIRYEKYLDTGVQTQQEIIARLLKKLENIAATHKIKITNVMPGEIEEKPIYKIYKTTLDFEGSLQDTLLFMDELEAAEYLFDILRYSMEPKNKSGQVLKVNMDVTRILINAEDLQEFQEEMDRLTAEAAPPEVAAEMPEEGGMGTADDMSANGSPMPEPI